MAKGAASLTSGPLKPRELVSLKVVAVVMLMGKKAALKATPVGVSANAETSKNIANSLVRILVWKV